MKKFLRGILTKVRRSDWKQQYAEIKTIVTEEQLIGFQKKYLERLLLHAERNVPYYHGIFDRIGLIKNGRVDLSRFGRIPMLTKEIMRQHGEELTSRDYTTRKWYYNSSGGSTGEPVRFIQDYIYKKWGEAAFYYWYKDIVGIDEPEVKKVILWGSGGIYFRVLREWKSKIHNWLKNTVYLNSFKMTEQDIDRYIKTINSYKPDLIRGYAGSLYELCRYAERRDMEVYTPQLVVSSAEMLTGEMRAEIEKVLGAKVYDYYGSRETNNIAGECREGLMHILAFRNYIEILDNNNQPVKEGEEGRAVVTNLHNYSMPFIRYDIGDMAVLGPNECKCGSPLPTLRKITGRITDHFVGEDGALFSGPVLTGTLNLKDWVKEFQIIQEDYKRVRFLIVGNENVNESEKREVEDKIKFLLGQDCQIVWDFVGEIPKTPQGKYLYIKSLVRR